MFPGLAFNSSSKIYTPGQLPGDTKEKSHNPPCALEFRSLIISRLMGTEEKIRFLQQLEARIVAKEIALVSIIYRLWPKWKQLAVKACKISL